MKIAYLFRGHVRTWNKCYQNFFDNIYSVAPGDIFIHTWDRINAKTGAHWNGETTTLTGELETISSQILPLKEIIQAYNPKHIVVETDTCVDLFRNKYPEHISSPTLCIKNYLYSTAELFKLALKHEKYDKFFLTRPDLNFLEKIDINYFNNEQPMAASTGWDNSGAIFDFWFLGNFNQTKIFAEFDKHIDEYWLYKTVYNYIYEQALGQYLQDNQIKPVLSKLKFNVPRINGTVYERF